MAIHATAGTRGLDRLYLRKVGNALALRSAAPEDRWHALAESACSLLTTLEVVP